MSLRHRQRRDIWAAEMSRPDLVLAVVTSKNSGGKRTSRARTVAMEPRFATRREAISPVALRSEERERSPTRSSWATGGGKGILKVAKPPSHGGSLKNGYLHWALLGRPTT